VSEHDQTKELHRIIRSVYSLQMPHKLEQNMADGFDTANIIKNIFQVYKKRKIIKWIMVWDYNNIWLRTAVTEIVP